LYRQLLPNGANSNNLIAFAWENLNPAGGGTIEYFTTGAPPNRQLIVEFTSVPHSGGGNNITSQVILYEGSNAIEIHTTAMPTDGGGHTMGIENIDGSEALTVPGRNSNGGWSVTNDFVQFTPIPCTNIEIQTVVVIPNPIAGFSISDTTVCLGESIQLADVSTGSPVSWSWDFGDTTTSTLQNPVHTYSSGGIYSVTLTVTSANGCQDIITKVITVFGLNLIAGFSATTECLGNSTQFADSTIGSPVNWNWDFGDGNSSTQQNPIYLYTTPGTYNVQLVVVNSFGCGDAITLSITVNPNPTAGFGAATGCFGDPIQFTDQSTGSPASWNWYFGDTTTSALQNPIHTYASAGSYSVTLTVTDANGCSDVANIAIEQPTAVTANISAYADISCNGNSDGTATATVSGGTPGYTWLWSSGGVAAIETGLSAGTYTAVVTDANGCMASDTVVIAEPPAITISSEISTDITCNGLINGTITITASGGTGTLKYSINGGITFPNTTGVFTNRDAGSYDIAVQDANGCTQYGSTVAIIEPSALTAATTATDAAGSCDGDATVIVNGGIFPYNFIWDDPGNQTSQTATGLCSGVYNVTVTDTNGCTVFAAAMVGVASGIADQDMDNSITIYPNPNTGQFTLEMNIPKTQDIQLIIINMLGQQVYSEKLNKIQGSYQKQIDISTYSKGIYNLQLLGDKMLVNKKIIIE